MSTRATALVLGLLLIVSFLGVGREPWTPDEPREAEISREMWLASVGGAVAERHRVRREAAAVLLDGGRRVRARRRPVRDVPRARSARVAAFLTLLLVFFWGRREFSPAVGVVAAIGLATSVQFMISTHWIVMDPLLMLFTTAAAWAGSELVQGRGRARVLLAFYGALTLALWTKGLIGPVLIASGLLVYAAARRSLEPVWRVRPFLGVAVMVLMTGVIAALIYADAGTAAVREWLWVNHVQRFVHPTYTGHDQPFYYYLSALPIALFPWWVPFALVLAAEPLAFRADLAAPQRMV